MSVWESQGEPYEPALVGRAATESAQDVGTRSCETLDCREVCMRVLVFRPDETTRNFGDELNVYLWSRLLPELEDAPGVMMGIGTLLEPIHIPEERPLIVFGTGAGYGPVPDLTTADVRFVRGPKTAKVLGIPHRWITDPGILVHDLVEPKPVRDFAFVARWTIMQKYPAIAEDLTRQGVFVIDTRWEPEKVLAEIAASRCIIAEAFHGAVCADALRIPWIPVFSETLHFFKWFDWSASMSVPYDPQSLAVVGVPWVRDNVTPQLSSDSIFRARLWQIKNEVAQLRRDLRKAA